MTSPNASLIQQHERELTPYLAYLNTKHNRKISVTVATTSALLQQAKRDEGYFELPDNDRYQRLLLVDEAHIGLSGKEEGAFWSLRERLNQRQGFTFEYSATYHNLAKAHTSFYEHSIVYDYNYSLFYLDYYGKDFWFKEVGDDVGAEEGASIHKNLNENLSILTDKLEAFAHCQEYGVDADLFRQGQKFPHKPLIAFMGNTVNSKKEKEEEGSDIERIVYYLAGLSSRERETFAPVFNHQCTGKLVLTRNKDVPDEILLSYGDGEYFGLINVGDRDKFFLGFRKEELVMTREGNLLPLRCRFESIDSPDSPVNILLGSRKFAEGWNCFRVSVIGLINMGSAKGNKIIQIFGRGVRLQGIAGDGKRIHREHVEDYRSLSRYDYLKKLETLVVLSLKKSYLQAFTNEVHAQVKFPVSFRIPVTPQIVPLGTKAQTSFVEIAQKLPVFKLSRTQIDQKQVVFEVDTGNYHNIQYNFFEEGRLQTQNIARGSWEFSLDYRSDRTREGYNVANQLRDYAHWIDENEFARSLQEFEIQTELRLYTRPKEHSLTSFTLTDVLASGVILEIIYDEPLDLTRLETINRLQQQVCEDFWKRLRNKINYLIDSQHYVFNEPLRQNSVAEKGDFVSEYVVSKTYPTQPDKALEESRWRARQAKLEMSNIPHHLYQPLLLEDDYSDKWKISPTGLNPGERKLVVDLEAYIQNWPGKPGLEFYLLRNVETLKSLGFYMNREQHVFYPDFLFWIIDPATETYYLNFLDPKGIRGIKERWLTDVNGKADNSKIMREIEAQFKQRTPYQNIRVNSFILLRDSSDLDKKDYEQAVGLNILRLNWHQTNEVGRETTKTEWYQGKTYLEIMFEKLGLLESRSSNIKK